VTEHSPLTRKLIREGLSGTRHTLKRPIAKGAKDPRFPDHTQIAVRIEDELFAEIRALAVSGAVSLSEQVRILLEWGLEAAKQDAAA
jgi:hypothetical protein